MKQCLTFVICISLCQSVVYLKNNGRYISVVQGRKCLTSKSLAGWHRTWYESGVSWTLWPCFKACLTPYVYPSFRLWHWKHTPTLFMSRYSWTSNMCQHSVKIEQLLLISFGKERGGYYVCSLPVVAYIFIEWYTFTTISIHVFPVWRNYVLLDLVYPQYGTLVSLDECVSVLNQI